MSLFAGHPAITAIILWSGVGVWMAFFCAVAYVIFWLLRHAIESAIMTSRIFNMRGTVTANRLGVWWSNFSNTPGGFVEDTQTGERVYWPGCSRH